MSNRHISRRARKSLLLQNARMIDAQRGCAGFGKRRATLLTSDGVEQVRGNRILSFLAALLFASGPYQVAFAQDTARTVQDEASRGTQDTARNVGVARRQHPEYDPLGMRFGGFNLNASLELAVENSSNFFAEETGEEEETYFVARPDATLSSNWSRHALYVGAGGAFDEHENFSSENSSSGYLRAGGRLDVSRNTIVGADLRVAREVETRTDPDSVITVEPVEYDYSSISGYISHTLNRVQLRADAAQTTYDFQNAGEPTDIGFQQDYRDRTDTTFGGRVGYAITPRLALLTQVTWEDREYDVPNVSPNSDGTTYLAGVAFELSSLVRGEFSAGQFERDYTPTAAVPNVGSISGTALAANVEWFATPLTTVTFNASRGVEESSYENPYVNTTYSARVDHELLRNVILSAGVAVADREFEGIDRDDNGMMYDIGARYVMNRRVSFGAAYGHNETESDGLDAYRTFDEDHLRLSVRFTL